MHSLAHSHNSLLQLVWSDSTNFNELLGDITSHEVVCAKGRNLVASVVLEPCNVRERRMPLDQAEELVL
jgi:hypothetical protein